jgi:hypothetical protein
MELLTAFSIAHGCNGFINIPQRSSSDHLSSAKRRTTAMGVMAVMFVE